MASEVSLEDLLKQWYDLGPGGPRGNEMARRLKALAERHQPMRTDVEHTFCAACQRPWPCPDYVVLNGGEVAEEAFRRLKALDELHRPEKDADGEGYCRGCGHPWPCTDSVILNGEVSRG